MFKLIFYSQLLKKYSRANNVGFTLIELLVIIAIIGVLSAVAVVNLSSAKDKAREAAALQELANINPVILLCVHNELDLYCGNGEVCLNYFEYARNSLFSPNRLSDNNFLFRNLLIKNAKAAASSGDRLDSYRYEGTDYSQRPGVNPPDNPPPPPPTPLPDHPPAAGGFRITPEIEVYWPDLAQYGWEYSDMVLYDFDKTLWEIHAQNIANNNRRITCSENGCEAYDL